MSWYESVCLGRHRACTQLPLKLPSCCSCTSSVINWLRCTKRSVFQRESLIHESAAPRRTGMLCFHVQLAAMSVSCRAVSRNMWRHRLVAPDSIDYIVQYTNMCFSEIEDAYTWASGGWGGGARRGTCPLDLDVCKI